MIKKSMKIGLLTSVISGSAFAGFIVPNIQRAEIRENESGAAVARSTRNNASLLHRMTKTEVKTINLESEKTEVNNQVFLNKDNMSGEFRLLNNEGNRDYQARVGMISGQFAYGGRLDIKDTNDTDESELALSTSYDLGDGFLLGAGVDHKMNSTTDIAQTGLFLGAGYVKEGLTVEGLIRYRGDDIDTTAGASEGELLGFRGEVTVQPSSQLEVHFELTYDTIKNEFSELATNTEETDLNLNLELEYLLNEEFALGLLAQYSDNEEEDKNASSTIETAGILYGPRVRYKTGDFQVTGEYLFSDSEIKDAGVNSDIDANTWQVGVTYFF